MTNQQSNTPSKLNFHHGEYPPLDPNAYIESITKQIFLLRDRLKLYHHDALIVHAINVTLRSMRDEIQGIFEAAPADMEFARQMFHEMSSQDKANWTDMVQADAANILRDESSSMRVKVLAFGKVE